MKLITEDPLSDERIEEFLHKITKPIFVWRLARGWLSKPPDSMTPDQQRSAQTRRSMALGEIRDQLQELLR